MTTRWFRVWFVSLAIVFAGWCAQTAGRFTVAAADFRFTSIRVTNSDVRLSWNAPGGSNYVVQTVTTLGGSFTDLGAPAFVANSTGSTLSYTHTGAWAGATQRFYRVRAFPPPSLQIMPTNAVIGHGMTNRYKVMLITDGVALDVTTNASLTFTSLHPTVAQFTRTTNGFALVRALNNSGTATLQASYLGVTNTAVLAVSTLTGIFTAPSLSTINGYVQGSNTPVKVFGIFANGTTNNITPASNLQGTSGNPFGTRLDYLVSANVANSFALITGQSAAQESVFFAASVFLSQTTRVNWCWFTGLSLVPNNARISIGATQQFTVFGHMANGVTTNALAVVSSPVFSSSASGIAEALSGLRVAGRTNGRVTLDISFNNGPGDSCAGGIATCTTFEVGTPTNDVGNVDKTFNFCLGTTGSVGRPYAIATQPDGRILIGGPFFYANGAASFGIQRLLPDGNVDGTFRRPTAANDSLNSIVVQPDGKILMATIYHPVLLTHALTRLNADGSLDANFVSTTNATGPQINVMALQPDGKIVVGGFFTVLNGVARNYLARLHPNGVVDETFNTGTGPSSAVGALAVDSLSRIYIGGNFTNVNGIVRMRIARLTPEGAVDMEFEPSTGANDSVTAIAVRESGGYAVLVGGYFTTFRGLPSRYLASLYDNGLLMPSPLAPPVPPGVITSMALQSDGKAVMAANFIPWRLTASNTLDSTFSLPGGVTGGGITALSVQSNRAINVIGNFTGVGGLARGKVARLLQNQPATVALWNFNSPVPDADPTTGTLLPWTGHGSVSYLNSTAALATGFAAGSSHDTNTTDNSAWVTTGYPLPATSNKTAGVQFNVSTVGFERMVLSWDQRASSSGSKYARLQYSTNGLSFVDFPSAVSVSAANLFASQTCSLEGIPSVNNNSNFAFRIVAEFENTAIGAGVTNYVGAGGSYATTGTLRFDQVTVSGVPLAPP